MSQADLWASHYFSVYPQLPAYQEGTLGGQPSFSSSLLDSPNPAIIEVAINSQNLQIIS